MTIRAREVFIKAIAAVWTEGKLAARSERSDVVGKIDSSLENKLGRLARLGFCKRLISLRSLRLTSLSLSNLQ
jgi:hypothetical protein